MVTMNAVNPMEPAAPGTAAAPGALSAKQIYSRLGWAYFVLMALCQGLALAASVALALLWPAGVDAAGWLVWAVSYVPLYGVAAPVFGLMVTRMFPKTPAPAADTPMTAGLFAKLFVLLMGGTYILNYVSLGINYLISGQLVNTLGDVTQAAGYWPSVAVGCVIAPIGEELLFRKALWRAVAPLGEKAYALVGGLVFALFHGNLSQLLYAFLAGMALCWLYVRTGRLGWCIALHMAINTMGIAIGPLALASDTAALVISALVMALMASALVLFVRGVRRVHWRPAGPGAPAHPLRRALATPGMAVYALLCLGLVIYASALPLLG